MRIISQIAASYAKFSSVVASLGTPRTVYYAQSSGNLLDAHLLFEDRDVALNVAFSGGIATSTLTNEFPSAIEANVTIS